MTTRTPQLTYRTLLALPGAAAFAAAAAVGRVGVAATGLGLVWLVHGASGSFGAAGLAVAAFAAAEAVVSPRVARLVDRRGQTAVLPVVLAAHAAAVGLLLLAVGSAAPGAVVVAACAAAGASTPQLGALSSVRWVGLLERDRSALPRAFALESLVNAVAFLVGPVLVSLLSSSRPWAGSTAAVALVLTGGLALAAQRRTAPPVAAPRTTTAAAPPWRLPGRGAVLLVLVSGLLGVHFGGLSLCVIAWGGSGGAAPLLAVSSGAGLLAAWGHGLRTWRTPPPVQLVLAGAALAAGCAVMALAGGTPALVGGLVVAAAVVPVVVVQVGVLLERCVPLRALTEALAWTGSASAAGSATGAAAVGAVVDGAGAAGGFALLAATATGLTALTTGLAVSERRAASDS